MNDERLVAEAESRALVETWAAAVRAGDLEGVLADHADDIHIFDVPPPNDVRGIGAYRATWPPFFDWLRRGARFEIESLDVTAGGDVAFATALLRCGTEEDFERDPENRLRLTVGAAQGRRPLGRLARASLLPGSRMTIRGRSWPS
jgi:ketosteroid isomerase-like protein